VSSEDSGRTDLIKAIMRVLPVDPVSRKVPLSVGRLPEHMSMSPIVRWGDPETLARRILDALDSAYTDRDMQTDHEYERWSDTTRGEEFF
jgi:hypothetical protein